jgi:hypothetical protein
MKTTRTPRRDFLRLLGATAVGVAASAAFGPAIRRAAAEPAATDRRPQSARQRPRWIGHF